MATLTGRWSWSSGPLTKELGRSSPARGSAVVGLLAGAGVVGMAAARYRSSIQAAYDRLGAEAWILPSPYGDIEYTRGGAGPPVLVVHGAGGGRDQGALIAEAILGEGFRWIAPSRFGYLLEAQGIATVALSMIPEFTASVGAPRVAGIEFPFGRPMGLPGDQAGQRAVLQAALEVARGPGTVVQLPFRWPQDPREAGGEPPVPPPIVQLLKRKPWLALRLLAHDIPEPQQLATSGINSGHP